MEVQRFTHFIDDLLCVVRPMVESNVTPRFLGGSDGFGTTASPPTAVELD